jgi:hypothetical protein
MGITKDEYESYLTRIETFREWFNDKIMCIGQDESVDAVMVLPYGIAEPKYRDAPSEYVDPNRQSLGVFWC